MKKKLISLLLCFTLCLGILPVASVFADGENFKLSFEKNNYTYDEAQGTIEYKNSNSNWQKVTNDITNAVAATAVRVKPATGYELAGHSALRLNGVNQLENQENKNALLSDGGLSLTNTANTYEFENVQFVQPGGPQPPQHEFDGTVYFVWIDNGTLCKYEIRDISQRGPESHDPPETKYVKLSDVKDGANTYQIGMPYYFIWKDKIGQVTTVEDFEKLNTDEGFRRNVAVNPAGAEDGPSTICTNGDGMFSLTIYDEAKYAGVSFDEENQTYKPDPFLWGNFTNATIDLADSTIDNPAVYETFIGNAELTFQATEISKAFKSVEPIGISNEAVNVTKEEQDFKLSFKSNFYDHVIFKITTQNNQTYYVQILRTAIRIEDNFGRGKTDDAALTCKLFYDKSQPCDYIVYATLYREDGTMQTKEAELVRNESGGDNLDMASFKVLIGGSAGDPASRNVVGADFNVIKKGTTDTTFGGAYCGSDDGTYYEVR